MSRIDYILVDWENTQPKNLEMLTKHSFKVLVFVGEKQERLPFSLVEAMQHLGEKGDYIKIARSGKNALDFHIAYYIGRLSVENPASSFHIISKDQGFTPLIEHLETKNIKAFLHRDIAEIPVLRMPSTMSDSDKVDEIVKRLTGLGNARPRKEETLRSSIKSWFAGKLEDSTLDAIIDNLQRDGRIQIREDGTLTYTLSPVKSVRRSKPSPRRDTAEIPALDMAGNMSDSGKVDEIVTRLTGLGNARPRKETTLRSSIKSWSGGELEDSALDAIIDNLQKRQRIQIKEDGTLTYKLPPSKSAKRVKAPPQNEIVLDAGALLGAGGLFGLGIGLGKASPQKGVAEIPALRTASNMSDSRKVDEIVTRLTGLGNARPRKEETLRRSIKSWFEGKLEDSTLDAIIVSLQKRRRIQIKEDGTLTYTLPPSKSRRRITNL